MKSKWAIVLILIAGLNLSLLAEDSDSESRSRHYFFNFSLYYPVSINQSKSDSANFNLSLFYGISFPLGRLALNTDIGYMYLDNKNIFRGRIGDIDQHVTMLRASLNLELSNKLCLFAGSGLSYIKDRDALSGSGEFHPLFCIGLELF